MIDLKKFSSVLSSNFIIILILFTAAYLRFVNFPLKYGFDFDPTRDALIVSYGAAHLNFPLLGAKCVLGPFNFGPWYYWELIAFKILVPTLYSPWIFIGIMSILVVFVMYHIGRELEGKTFGLLLAVMTALSPEEIGPTTGLSNPNLVPIHAALTVLFSILYFKSERLSPWWVLIWGFILGVGINHHYQTLLLLPLPLLIFLVKYISVRSHKSLIKATRDLFIFGVGLTVSFIPLFIYDFSHHFRQFQGYLYFFNTSRHSIYIPNNWRLYGDFLLQSLSMILGIPRIPTIIFLISSVAILGILLFKRQLKMIYLPLILTLLLDIIFLRYFVVQRYLYYLLFIHPFIFILLGLAAWNIFKIKISFGQKQIKIGLIIGLAVSIIILPSVLFQSHLRVGTFSDLVQYRRETEIIMKSFPNQKISLYECRDKMLNRPQGIDFFLFNNHFLDSNGKKILLIQNFCTTEYLVNRNVSFKNISGIEAVELKTENLPIDFPWKPISPKIVYEDLFN